MTIRLGDIRVPFTALLTLLLFAVAGQVQAAEPVGAAQAKPDSGAPAASSKSQRKDAGSRAMKKPKPAARGDQPKADPASPEAIKEPVAKMAADGKQNQAQDIPCFKTKLCE